ncbi:MAG: IS110 family transposase [Bryobacteraceae bacterium]
MEVVYARCCGLDVHKKSISACIVIREQGKAEKLERRFGTYTGELEELAGWLAEHRVTHVVMEATGVYWRPVWNVLEGRLELMLVNPQHVKALSGKKFDRGDAAHLAELLQHGLLHGSYIPPQGIRQLRDLTRNRARTVQEAVRIQNRVQKILEEANFKLSSVASDTLGVSGRRMLKAVVDGEQDPEKLADLALGKLRKKREQLLLALAGRVTDHHRRMLDKLLRALEVREAEIAEDEQDIRQAVEPYRKAVDAWMQQPGIDEVTAWSLVAEMGPDMAAFATAEEAASWSCICPGNHESAGKQGDGRTRKGNPWLRSAICEGAWGAAHTKKSYFHAQYHRICARRGPQRALVAVAHSMIVVGFYLIKYDLKFKDLGVDFFDQRNREHVTRRAVKRLTSLGYRVILKAAPVEEALPRA